jgi:predicted transcriptional regulator
MCDVLMSIKPEFAEAILRGTKTVEFRKRQLPEGTNKVIIYATSPLKRVVGEFTVLTQFTDTPENIWNSLNEFVDDDSAEFFDYYSNNDKATAICIDECQRYDQTLSLVEIGWDKHPPMSFVNLR